tara:strand:- start:819 stop:1346 length:528 start_codon:yes stop_codon:yes gene_type:complete
MQKSEFIAKIKKLAKKAYAEKSDPLADPKDIAKELSPFPVINQFPPLQKIMDDLFDFQFEPFVKDIDWVAPRPTTFRIKLANKADFYIIYQGKNKEKQGLFVAQVSGKKYFLESLPEQQQASEAIARLLRYNYGKVEQTETDLGSDLGGETEGGFDTPTPETPPEPAVPDSVEDL